MGTLRYGAQAYPVSDTDLVALQLATEYVFADAALDRRVAMFTVEVRTDDRTSGLIFTPGVPLVFEVDTADPVHAGDGTAERFTDTARRHGTIEIWSGDDA